MSHSESRYLEHYRVARHHRIEHHRVNVRHNGCVRDIVGRIEYISYTKYVPPALVISIYKAHYIGRYRGVNVLVGNEIDLISLDKIKIYKYIFLWKCHTRQ